MRKRRVIAGMLVFAMALSVTACSKGKNDEVQTVNGVVSERPAYPDVKALDYITLPKDYKTMSVEVEPKITEVSDEDVENRIKQSLPSNEVEDEETELAMGDTAVIDLTGTIDGEEFENGSATDYTVTLGSKKLVNGFEEQLAGMTLAERKSKKTIRVVFPDTYSNEMLRGKMAVFDVKLKSFTHVTPMEELTEDEIKSLSNDNAKTLDEYKAYVKQTIQDEHDQTYEDDCETAMLDYLVENSDVKDLPESLYDWYYDSVYAVYVDYAETYNMTIENVFAANGIQGVTDKDSFKEYAESYAKDSILGELIPQAIAEDMKISFTEDEYKAYVDQMMKDRNYDKSVEEFENAYKKNTIEHWCVVDNVWKKLSETVKFIDKKEDDGTAEAPAIESNGNGSDDGVKTESDDHADDQAGSDTESGTESNN